MVRVRVKIRVRVRVGVRVRVSTYAHLAQVGYGGVPLRRAQGE